MISFNKAKGKRTGIIFITVGVTALISGRAFKGIGKGYLWCNIAL